MLNDSTYMSYLKVVKLIETESIMVAARCWGEGEKGSYFFNR